MSASRYASRKFLLVAVVVLYAIACNALGVAADPQWLGFVLSLVALYVAGNVGAALVAHAAPVVASAMATRAATGGYVPAASAGPINPPPREP